MAMSRPAVSSAPGRKWMVWLLTASLALNALVALWFAIRLGDDSAAQPSTELEAQRTWDDQRDMRWLYASGFKATMRSLWIDANSIVSGGRGSGQPAFREIEVHALGIARKASEMAGYWERVAKHASALAAAGHDDDWLLCAQELENTWVSCRHCHFEKWSPSYSHVSPALAEAWKKNQHRPMLHEEVDQAPPIIPNRIVMQGLSAAAERVASGIKARDTQVITSSVAEITQVAQLRISLWRRIETEARAIATLANRDSISGMPQHYTALRQVCFDCHTANVGPERPILYPMPWD